MAGFGDIFGGLVQGLAQGLPAGIQLGQKQEQLEIQRSEQKLKVASAFANLKKMPLDMRKIVAPGLLKQFESAYGMEVPQVMKDIAVKGDDETWGKVIDQAASYMMTGKGDINALKQGLKELGDPEVAISFIDKIGSAAHRKDVLDETKRHSRATEGIAGASLAEARAERIERRRERDDAVKERQEISALAQHEKLLDNNRPSIKEENQPDFVAALVKHPDYREAVGTRNRTRMDEIAAEIRGANPKWNKVGDRESKIADVMRATPGLSRGDASAVVDKLKRIEIVPQTGMARLIDERDNSVKEIPLGTTTPTTPAETPAQRDAKSADEVGDLLTQGERGPRFVQRDPTTKTTPAGVLPPEAPPGRPQNKPLYESAGEGKLAGVGSAVKELWSNTVGQIIPPGKQWQATLEARQDAKILARDFVRSLQTSPRMAEGERQAIAKEIDITPSMWDSKVHLQARMRSIDSRLRERLVDARKDAADPSLNQEMRASQAQNARHMQNFIGKLGVPPKGLPESYTRMGTTKEGFPVYGSPNVDRKKWMVDQY